MGDIFIDMVDQEPDIPKPEDRKPCEQPDCPGEKGWETCFGLAGGGYGTYTYCPKCGQIIDKTQSPDYEEDKNA